MSTPVPSPSPFTSTLDTAVSVSELILNLAQAAALVVAAVWAYNKFIRQRERWPRATMEHKIQHIDLGNKQRLLRVVEKVTNTGTVLLRLAERKTWIQQILPADRGLLAAFEAGDSLEAPWPAIGKSHEIRDQSASPEIEPGESDHFEHDFLVDLDVEVVQVYSHFQNVRRNPRWRRLLRRKDNRGWPLTTIYDLRTSNETTNRIEDAAGKEEQMGNKKESQQQPKQKPSVRQQVPKPAPQAKPQGSTGGSQGGSDKK